MVKSTIYFIKYKNKKYRLTFKDTSGQEKYKAVTKNFLRQNDGVLFIFDVSNEKTFNDLESWYDLYKEENDNVVGLLIGNKCDCDNKVNKEEVQKFADNHGLKYLETSARLDKNLRKAIACLLEEIIKSKELIDEETENTDYFSLKSDIKTEKLIKKKKCRC